MNDDFGLSYGFTLFANHNAALGLAASSIPPPVRPPTRSSRDARKVTLFVAMCRFDMLPYWIWPWGLRGRPQRPLVLSVLAAPRPPRPLFWTHVRASLPSGLLRCGSRLGFFCPAIGCSSSSPLLPADWG